MEHWRSYIFLNRKTFCRIATDSMWKDGRDESGSTQ